MAAAHREYYPLASTFGECWSMDFVADQLFNGRKIRASTVVDDYSRESLAILADFSLRGADVMSVMNHMKSICGAP